MSQADGFKNNSGLSPSVSFCGNRVCPRLPELPPMRPLFSLFWVGVGPQELAAVTWIWRSSSAARIETLYATARIAFWLLRNGSCPSPLSPMSISSLSSSPWRRGARQPRFFRHILWIRSRAARKRMGRPRRQRRTFQVQNKRELARCQATTVTGLTMASTERQSRQRCDR